MIITAKCREFDRTMADADSFPSSYPFFAPSSWSSIHTPKNQPRSRRHQKTIRKKQPSQDLKKINRPLCARPGTLHTKKRDRHTVHDIPLVIVGRHVFASNTTASPASMFNDFRACGLPTTQDGWFARAATARDPRAPTTAPGMHGIDLVMDTVPRDGRESTERGFTREALLLQERPSIRLTEVATGPNGCPCRGKQEHLVRNRKEGVEPSHPNTEGQAGEASVGDNNIGGPSWIRFRFEEQCACNDPHPRREAQGGTLGRGDHIHVVAFETKGLATTAPTQVSP
jgi:hypothetical protein